MDQKLVNHEETSFFIKIAVRMLCRSSTRAACIFAKQPAGKRKFDVVAGVSQPPLGLRIPYAWLVQPLPTATPQTPAALLRFRKSVEFPAAGVPPKPQFHVLESRCHSPFFCDSFSLSHPIFRFSRCIVALLAICFHCACLLIGLDSHASRYSSCAFPGLARLTTYFPR